MLGFARRTEVVRCVLASMAGVDSDADDLLRRADEAMFRPMLMRAQDGPSR